MIFGASLLLKVMERFPIIITIGGGLLGWVAGEMAVTDPAVSGWLEANASYMHHMYVGPILCTAIVLITGKVLSNRHREKSS